MMSNFDLFDQARTSFLRNKLRSGLTILGIVIGITSVILMLSIGNGASSEIQSSIASLGVNVISIQGKINDENSPTIELTEQDKEDVREVLPQGTLVSAYSTSSASVRNEDISDTANILGTDEAYQTMQNLKIGQGRWLIPGDKNEKVAVLGSTIYTKLFETAALPQQFDLGGNIFTVIGILKEDTNQSFLKFDEAAFIPFPMFSSYVSGTKTVQIVQVFAPTSEDIPSYKALIEKFFQQKYVRNSREVLNLDISDQTSLLETAKTITSTFSILLGAIGSIALVVGGIGIMNMMLTSVTERTKEIGLRKALGAGTKDIMKQFLLEAIFLTFLGGVVGLILGWLLCTLFNLVSTFKTVIDLKTVVLALGIASFVGLVFGYYPAKKAAQMNPIDALRYE